MLDRGLPLAGNKRQLAQSRIMRKRCIMAARQGAGEQPRWWGSVNRGDGGEGRSGDRAAVLSPEEKGARWCSPESGRAAALSPKEEGAQRRSSAAC
jgi:hypothetical protein